MGKRKSNKKDKSKVPSPIKKNDDYGDFLEKIRKRLKRKNKEANMIKELIYLANHLDEKGRVKEASYLDNIIRKLSYTPDEDVSTQVRGEPNIWQEEAVYPPHKDKPNPPEWATETSLLSGEGRGLSQYELDDDRRFGYSDEDAALTPVDDLEEGPGGNVDHRAHKFLEMGDDSDKIISIVDKLFTQTDTDGSGEISQEEYDSFISDLLSLLRTHNEGMSDDDLLDALHDHFLLRSAAEEAIRKYDEEGRNLYSD